MKRHLSSLLILSTALIAACQLSGRTVPPPNAQTQEAWYAFDSAVAAAQTQAAAQPTLAPPTPQTYSAETLALLSYLDGVVRNSPPGDNSPYDAQVVFVNYRADVSGNPSHMDVGIVKSNETRNGYAYGAIILAFRQIYADPSVGQRLVIPSTLQTYQVHLYDPVHKEHASMSGAWTDVVALGQGSLSQQDFINRLTLQEIAQ